MRKVLVLAFAVLLGVSVTFAQGRKKVVITSRGYAYSQIGDAELARFRAAAPNLNIVVVDDKNRMMAEVVDADGIIGSINTQILKVAKNLKWVQVHMAGVESILTPELKDSKVILTNCKVAQGPEIGDHAFAMLLALTRELHRIIPRRVQEEWPRNAYQPVELLARRRSSSGRAGSGRTSPPGPRRSGCMSPRWILEKSRHLRWWTGGFPRTAWTRCCPMRTWSSLRRRILPLHRTCWGRSNSTS